MAEWSFYVRVVAEAAVDSGNGLKFNLHGKDAQTTPAPTVYVDGILQSASTYTFTNGDQSTAASVTFATSKSGKSVRVTYRWKYECSANEDADVYEIEKEINQAVGKDVNGRTIIATAYCPTSSWDGVVHFLYVTQTFWEEWRIIADNAYAFDLERNGHSTYPQTLTSLFVTSYPRWAEMPGIPDLIHVGVELIAQEIL
jgi:hypothetical protein